jgi:hypothetical protein
MKPYYIFLDLDGVLFAYSPRIGISEQINYICENELLRLVDRLSICYDVKIVITSSRRRNDLQSTLAFLEEHGAKQQLLKLIVGQTEFVKDYCNFAKLGISLPRGVEIQHYIDVLMTAADAIDFQYIIIDDDTDMLYKHRDNFVHVDGDIGLTSADINAVMYKHL